MIFNHNLFEHPSRSDLSSLRECFDSSISVLEKSSFNFLYVLNRKPKKSVWAGPKDLLQPGSSPASPEPFLWSGSS